MLLLQNVGANKTTKNYSNQYGPCCTYYHLHCTGYYEYRYKNKTKKETPWYILYNLFSYEDRETQYVSPPFIHRCLFDQFRRYDCALKKYVGTGKIINLLTTFNIQTLKRVRVGKSYSCQHLNCRFLASYRPWRIRNRSNDNSGS